MSQKTLCFMICLVILIPCFTNSQTVAWKDLPRLVGAFTIPDQMNRDSFDVSRLVDWYIDSVDSNGNPLCYSASGPKETSGRRWLRMIKDDQHPYVCEFGGHATGGGEYLYYIMTDVHGGIYRWDALTIWRFNRKSDSVEFVTAQFDFGGSFTRVWVQDVTRFPDGSLLLHLESLGGDEEIWGGHSFLRGDSLANFAQFLHTYWESDETEQTRVLSDRMCSPVYEITLVTEYLYRDSLRDPLGQPFMRTVSVKAESVNLWELAKEHFQLKKE